MKRKLLSLILCLCLAASLIPAPFAIAQDNEALETATFENTTEQIEPEEETDTEPPAEDEEKTISEPTSEQTATISLYETQTAVEKENKIESIAKNFATIRKSLKFYKQQNGVVVVDGNTNLYEAFVECEEGGAIIVNPGEWNATDENGDTQIEVSSNIILNVSSGATISGRGFNITTGALAINGEGIIRVDEILGANIVITGGTYYNFNPTAYVDSNHIVTGDASNGFIVTEIIPTPTPTPTPEPTLQEIIAAETGSTVCLEKDYLGLNNPVKIDKNLILDLNGHTVSGEANCIFEIGGSQVTIQNGTIQNTATDGKAVTVTPKNSNVFLTTERLILDATKCCGFTVDPNYKTSWIISSGDYRGVMPEYVEGVSITGGTFSQNVSAYCAEGYECVFDEQIGKYIVREKINYVCRICDKDYVSLTDAVAAVQSGQTITLIDNITLTDETEIGNNHAYTIDLNGNAIRQSALKVSSGTVTFKSNGTISSNINASDGTVNLGEGTFNGNITGNANISGGMYKGNISLNGKTINGGIYTVAPSNSFIREDYECLQIADSEPEYAEEYRFKVVPLFEARILQADGSELKRGTLIEMLADASKDQTVQLLRNCDYRDTEITILKSIAIDLNGFNLISSYYTVTNANTIDTATRTAGGNPGLLLSANGYSFKEENTYLPMFDGSEGANGYRFFAYTIARYEPKEQKEEVPKSGMTGEIQTLKYKYAIRFANPDGYRILAQGGSQVNLYIGVTWDGSEKIFDLTTASLDALKKYGQCCWEAAQNQQTKYFSMFVRFWNYQNTLANKMTAYCLYVKAINGTLPITKTDQYSFEVIGEQQ